MPGDSEAAPSIKYGFSLLSRPATEQMHPGMNTPSKQFKDVTDFPMNNRLPMEESVCALL